MKIYISGKITGLTEEYYMGKFLLAESYLTEQGHTVINPTVLSDIPLEHDEYLHINKAMIDVCDTVYFLDNWQDSKGAVLEYAYAGTKEKRLMFEEGSCERADRIV